MPAGHTVHCCAAPPDAVPGLHGEHVVALYPAVADPLGHAEHALLPPSAWNVPGAHATHRDAATADDASPAWQGLHSVAELLA